jgi:hypothetical protein
MLISLETQFVGVPHLTNYFNFNVVRLTKNVLFDNMIKSGQFAKLHTIQDKV